MRLLKLSLLSTVALLGLWACSEKEDTPTVNNEDDNGVVNNGDNNNNDNGNTGEGAEEHDDTYYAANAVIGSDSEYFTETDEGGVIVFGVEGGEVVVNVQIGTGWTLTNDAGDWLGVAVDTSDGTLTVTAGENAAENVRTGTLTLLTATDRIKFATITVNQDIYDTPEISVDVNEVNLPAVGALAAQVTVEATYEWTASTESDWLTLSRDGNVLTITADENEDTYSRSYRVTVTSSNGVFTATETIIVRQDAKVYITLGSDSILVDADGGKGSMTVQSNYDVSAAMEDGIDWASAAVADGVLTVTVAENEAYEDRECNVTLTAGDGAENVVTATVKVTQTAATDDGYGDALVLEYTISKAGTTITLPFGNYTGLNCTVKWGDGEIQEVTTSFPTHTYDAAGVYEVKVNGTVPNMTYATANSKTSWDPLTAVLNWGNTGTTSMSNAFAYCQDLKTIPTDTRGAFAAVTTMNSVFYYCTALQEIPEGLLDNCSNVTEFSYAFYDCKPVKSIPEGLLDHCTAATNCSYMFGYTAISSIPEGLFDKLTDVTNLSYVFAYSSLASIPADLFKYNTKVTNLGGAFDSCSSLTSIPECLFDYNTEVTDFSMIFAFDSGITSIPSDIFAKNTKVTTFSYAFSFCAMTSIPADLFANQPDVTNFSSAFNYCSKLTSIPENLFANNKKVTNFSTTFGNCTALSGESAYDLVDGVKVHLYERGNYSDYATVTTTTNCYTKSTGLSDYNSIPSAWGGGGN